ncbi:MAG: methyltransferase domain-containing protein [Chloroflexota bacterium]
MRGLADVRVLVLAGMPSDSASQVDLDSLDRRTTAHRLALYGKSIPINLLRLLKRLAFGQDNVVLLYKTGLLPAMLAAIVVRLFGRRTLYIPAQGRSKGGSGLRRLIGTAPTGRRKGTSGRNSEVMLRGIARLVGRKWEIAQSTPFRIDLGCGSQVRQGFTGIDARVTPATAIVSDARAVAVASHTADEVYASCLLEHFENPHEVLREIHRILVKDGQAVLRLPNLGTYSSHLDLTHRFLADLALWRRILSGYFEEVDVLPVGTKYRDSPSLVKINWVLVNLFKWYELAQGWDFVCRGPRATPSIEYVAWWDE